MSVICTKLFCVALTLMFKMFGNIPTVKMTGSSQIAITFTPIWWEKRESCRSHEQLSITTARANCRISRSPLAKKERNFLQSQTVELRSKKTNFRELFVFDIDGIFSNELLSRVALLKCPVNFSPLKTTTARRFSSKLLVQKTQRKITEDNFMPVFKIMFKWPKTSHCKSHRAMHKKIVKNRTFFSNPPAQTSSTHASKTFK